MVPCDKEVKNLVWPLQDDSVWFRERNGLGVARAWGSHACKDELPVLWVQASREENPGLYMRLGQLNLKKNFMAHEYIVSTLHIWFYRQFAKSCSALNLASE